MRDDHRPSKKELGETRCNLDYRLIAWPRSQGVASFVLVRMLSDPLRLVEEFPFQRYYDNPRALAGNRFKEDFDVVEHLGRKEGFGRLVVVASAKTSDPVVVLLPPKLDEASLRSGQKITTELRVQDDGLIEVISLRTH